jgi:hypothetical protein
VAALGLPALTGCSDLYLDRRDTLSFQAGNAMAANTAVHMVDPWPPYAGDRSIPADGQRMQAAIERYRTNRVAPLHTQRTSSVQYAPVIAVSPPASGN